MVEGSGRIAAQRAQFDLRVARARPARPVLEPARARAWPGRSQLDLEPKRQRVQGTLAQDDMSLTADAERSGDVVEVRALRARAAGGEASGRGRVHLGKAPNFEADLKLARFDPSRFGDYPKGSLNGSVKGKGALGAARRRAASRGTSRRARCSSSRSRAGARAARRPAHRRRATPGRRSARTAPRRKARSAAAGDRRGVDPARCPT